MTMTTAMEVVRRRVPNDNSCLFYAIAYNCDPQQGQELLGVAKEDGDADAVTTADAATTEAKQQELRKVCASVAENDPDPDTRALLLGMGISEYAEWIMVEHHWGGENEVICLAAHVGCKIAVVSAETVLT